MRYLKLLIGTVGLTLLCGGCIVEGPPPPYIIYDAPAFYPPPFYYFPPPAPWMARGCDRRGYYRPHHHR
jgi:hypothetical protein